MVDARVTAPFPALSKAQYMSLTTFRKSGQAVATPVWFVEHAGALYVQTETTAGKIKRIRNNPKTAIAPCNAFGNVSGLVADAHARILTDPAEMTRAESLLAKKYGVLRIGYFQMLNIISAIRRHPHADSAYIALEPIRPEPIR